MTITHQSPNAQVQVQDQEQYKMTGQITSTPGVHFLPPFPPAVTEADVKASTTSYEPSYIIRNLTDLSTYLITLVKHTSIFGSITHDPYSPSLKTLHDRLYAGHIALSPLPGIAKDAERLRKAIHARVNMDVSQRPLEDFEDLYYALLARMKDISATLSVRVSNGFNAPSSPIFPSGPTLASLHSALTSYYLILNHPSCVRALDDAIRQARVNRLYEEIHLELEANVITQADADELLVDLYENRESTEGVAWIGGWSAAMMGAWLEEKWRLCLKVQREEDERVEREVRRQKKMAKAMGVKSRKGSVWSSRSSTKRTSAEKILQDAGRVRRGPAKQVRVVQQAMDDAMVEAQHVEGVQGQVQPVDDHDWAHQEQLQRDREWQLKSQRVSEYSNYLRGAASHGARSIFDSTTYGGSLNGSTIFGSTAPQTPDRDLDEIEF
jgi:hypothetical protein